MVYDISAMMRMEVGHVGPIAR